MDSRGDGLGAAVLDGLLLGGEDGEVDTLGFIEGWLDVFVDELGFADGCWGNCVST